MLITAEKWVFTDITERIHEVLSTVNDVSAASQPIVVRAGDTKVIEVCAYLKDWVISSGIIVALGTVISNEYNMKLRGRPIPLHGYPELDWLEPDMVTNTTQVVFDEEDEGTS